jgi:hypothetical protein
MGLVIVQAYLVLLHKRDWFEQDETHRKLDRAANTGEQELGMPDCCCASTCLDGAIIPQSVLHRLHQACSAVLGGWMYQRSTYLMTRALRSSLLNSRQVLPCRAGHMTGCLHSRLPAEHLCPTTHG